MRTAIIILGVLVLTGSLVMAGGDEVNKTWTDTIKVSGDLRLRYQGVSEETKPDRTLLRLRARVGAEADVNERVKAGVMLATGSADPTGENQTLTDGFSHKTISLSLAYVDCLLWKDLNAVGGKIKNPFINVSDLIWDTDVNPEGIALKAKYGNENLQIMGNAGSFWVTERATDADTRLYAGQLAAKCKRGSFELTVGASYYTYDNLEGYGLLDPERVNNAYGNTAADQVSGVTTSKVYTMGYNMAECFAEAAVVTKIPIRLFAQCVINTDADNNDTGYAAGLGLGKLKDPGSYELGYSFIRLEKDAVLGALTDGDRWGGGTDGQCNKFSVKYQIAKGLQAGAAYYMSEKTISDEARQHDYDRIQFDLLASF